MATRRLKIRKIALLFLFGLLKGTFPFILPNRLRHERWTAKPTSWRWFEYDKGFSDINTRTRRSKSLPTSTNPVDNGEEVFDDLTPICRIVTRSGSCIPTDPTTLPSDVYQNPYLFDKLDAYYHAKARNIQQDLSPLLAHERERIEIQKKVVQSRSGIVEVAEEIDEDERKREAPVLRQSLEDSGFKLLNERDIDLCESLNAGYLLRLSLLPDVKELDPIVFKEFYPERFYANGTLKAEFEECDDMLFDGRILVYWRGYSQEVTKGRLLLPKLDYLQANLVQRAAVFVKNQLDQFESSLFRTISSKSNQLRRKLRTWRVQLVEYLQIRQFTRWIGSNLSDGDQLEDDISVTEATEFSDEALEDASSASKRTSDTNRRKRVLSRYGGSKTFAMGSPDPLDALSPFTVCEIGDDENEDTMDGEGTTINYLKNLNATTESSTIEESILDSPFTCAYDGFMSSNKKALPRMQLLERVSIGSLIDVYNKVGRRGLLQTIMSKSELVEPTYEEVVVVWRPQRKQKKKIAPPKIVSEFADMFDIEGFEQPEEDESEPQTGPLEVRLFEQVPMSNLQAVTPKSKLVFRPADAVLFDTISFATFAIVLGSLKFDNTRLDVLAIVSVTLWILRTVFRYSNKLARYDLLVKKFLTSKISQRNSGACKYLSDEAGSQKAIRAALVHRWILYEYETKRSTLTRSMLERNCETQVNQLLNTENEVQIDVKGAIQDLEELKLIRFSESGDRVVHVEDNASSIGTIEKMWMDLLKNEQLFSANSLIRKGMKSEPVVTEDSVEILDVLEEIDAAAANVQKLSASDWKERRKKLASVMEEKKGESIAKAKAALEEKKEESIAKAKAVLEEKKKKSIARAKEVLVEQKDVGITKAREFLAKKGNTTKQKAE